MTSPLHSTQPDQEKGKTFADVFDKVLSDWRSFLSFVGLVLALCVVVMILSIILPKALGVSTRDIRELNISTSGARILLESVTDKDREYIIVVSPQGWQRSGVELKKGDRVKFLAEGSVNVDLWGVVQKATKRHEIEAKIAAIRGINPKSTDPKAVPEHYFSTDLSKEEQDSLTLLWMWTGPNGNEEVKSYNNAYAGRIAKRVLPNAPIGALIGAVIEKVDTPPVKQDAFLIGRNYKGEEYHCEKDGQLWLNINDVWDDDNPGYPNKFYDDNFGNFWVKVFIKEGR